ncbi:hypothetical protein CRYUN_Cryun40dG0084500 [Craigia yunnanensis]
MQRLSILQGLYITGCLRLEENSPSCPRSPTFHISTNRFVSATPQQDSKAYTRRAEDFNDLIYHPFSGVILAQFHAKQDACGYHLYQELMPLLVGKHCFAISIVFSFCLEELLKALPLSLGNVSFLRVLRILDWKELSAASAIIQQLRSYLNIGKSNQKHIDIAYAYFSSDGDLARQWFGGNQFPDSCSLYLSLLNITNLTFDNSKLAPNLKSNSSSLLPPIDSSSWKPSSSLESCNQVDQS